MQLNDSASQTQAITGFNMAGCLGRNITTESGISNAHFSLQSNANSKYLPIT